MKWVIGIDEVGRGPLAGPITVAAVATAVGVRYHIPNTKSKKVLANIKDSKKLSARQREEWFRRITYHAGFYITHASVGPQAIDRHGITKAARTAVARCLQKLSKEVRPPGGRGGRTSAFQILLDGSLYAPADYHYQQTIIKGDEKIPLIAAASIIAKVRRDRTMTRLAKKFPHYHFEIHKGYGTKMHQNAIQRHGLSSVHRASFCSRWV